MIRSRRELGRVVPLFAAVVLSWSSITEAALPGGRMPAPRLVGPTTGIVAQESGLRLAWAPPAGSTRQVIVLSRESFDARNWSRAPAGSAFRVVEVTRPVAAFSELGLKLDGESDLYWAVGAGGSATGALAFSETRHLRVLPRFSNRIEPTPYLRTSPVSAMAPTSEDAPLRVRLAAGYEIDPAMGEPPLPQGLRGGSLPPTASRNLLVHYGTDDPEKVRERVAASGGQVIAYIPDRTFLVRLRPQQGFSLSSPGAWVGEYQPAYKLSTALDRQTATSTSVTVLGFPDGDLESIEAAVREAGGTVTDRSDNGINKLLRASIPGIAVEALAQHADVKWIEPQFAYELHNSIAQWITLTYVSNNRRVWDLGIQGQGQVLHHSDSGIDMTHELFSDASLPVTGVGQYPTHRKVIAYELGSDYPDIAFGDHSGASYHGSHTAGTALGRDLTAPLSGYDGMAREAKVWHSDLAGPTMSNGLAPPLDLNELFQPSYTGNAGGAARLSSNSWGASAAAGAYTVDAANVDRFMWDHPEYLILFSTGNSGGTSTVGSPATSKNSVGVGGTRNSSTAAAQYYTLTSKGPTDDGRRKPTLCAPGQTVTSANAGPATYVSLSGTSMSTPGATGAAALMRQYCQEGWYPTGTKVPANGFTPSAALVKAMLVNSAVNNVFSGTTQLNAPDYNIGYGRVCVDSTLFFVGDRRRLLLVDFTEGLGHGQQVEFHVNVVNDSTPLEATLCWTDYPASVSSTIQLVNNLNLIVTNGVVTYRGNIYSAGFSNTGGTADVRNVEEAVNIKFPAPGIWTIRVEAPNVPNGPQPFGLAITGGVGTNAGVLTLDRASYGSGSTVELQVVDTNAGASVDVTVTSPSEPAGETITIPGANGLYQGTITLSPIQGSSGDDVLQVSHGDVITATYNDASPVAAMTQNATVQLAGPVITNVSAASNAAASATVSWNTNVVSNSVVRYGTTTALGSTATSDLNSLVHGLTLTGLAPGQSYYYDVESEDLNGNLTVDDNGGQHYRFTVRQPGDLLLVYSGDYEYPARYAAELDALGWQYDTWDGTLGDSPVLGHLGSGMRSYDVVWVQAGIETYPPISDVARDTITAYLSGGGRLGVVGHDIVWSNSDPASPYFSVPRATWTQSVLKTLYSNDPPTWTGVIGVTGDPISGTFTGGLPYTEFRSGAAGDEVDPVNGGTGAWLSNDGSPDTAGVRWDSGSPQGTAGNGVWGGQNSRLTTMWFEWGRIDPNANTSATRRDVLDKSLTWLLGRGKPAITVTFPNGGETVTASTLNVTWNETLEGASAQARTIEYSLDGGDSWTVLTSSAGASPYVWNLSGVPNTIAALVRVRVTDNGAPSFTGYDNSDAVFAIQRAGGDIVGPTVIAGSTQTTPNPVSNQAPATLNATISDVNSGGSNVTGAEWSFGPTPDAPGTGYPMTVAGGSPTQGATTSLPTGTFPTGTHQLWVRGQDSEGNWGPAVSITLIVNGDPSVSTPDSELPVAFELRAFAPNPVVGISAIRFAMPQESRVKLAIFDVSGRRVRTLVDQTLGAGLHTRSWDRSDESGRIVQPGVYYARMEVAGRAFQRKIVTLN